MTWDSSCKFGCSRRRAGVATWEVIIEPVPEVGHLGVDPQLAWIGTTKAPADHSDQALSVVVGRVGYEERATTVSLASVLSSFHESSTEHVRSHVPVHIAAVPVSKHSDIDLVKGGWTESSRCQGSPTRDSCLTVGEGGSLSWQADGLDVGIRVEIDCSFKFENGNVILDI